MKNKVFLILVRHAAAADLKPNESDADRPLTGKGRNQAKEMALELKRLGLIPFRFISSPARRAMETATIFTNKLNPPKPEIVEEEALYSMSDPRKISELLRNLPVACQAAAVFGHNPLFERAASYFIPDYSEPFRKGSVVVIQFFNWRTLHEKSGVLVHRLSPG